MDATTHTLSNLDHLKKGAVVVFEDDITALLTDHVLSQLLEKADLNPSHAQLDIEPR